MKNHNKDSESLWSLLASCFMSFFASDDVGAVKSPSTIPPVDSRPEARMVAAAKHFSNKVNFG